MNLLCRAVLLSFACAVLSIVRGEILPSRNYTTSDGLVSNFVQNIVRDSKGFLWFLTRGGLSRFDGHTFKNYTTADGLPHPTLNSLLETRGGEYWIATNGGGAARLNQMGSAEKFTVFKTGDTGAASRVNVLYEDRSERLWATTDGGLFLFDREANEFRFFPLEPEAAPASKYLTWFAAEDSSGAMWVGGRSCLYRLSPAGVVKIFSAAELGLEENIEALSVNADRNGRIWLGSRSRMHLLRLETPPGVSPVEREIQILEPTYDDYIIYCFQLSDGKFLLTTSKNRLIEFDGERRRELAPDSFAGKNITNGAEDTEGNIWLCTHTDGALRVSRNGFVRFSETTSDGDNQAIMSLSETPGGTILAFQANGTMLRLDGRKFDPIRPRRAGNSISAWMSGGALLDSAGEFWLLTSNRGLLRFPSVGSDLTKIRQAAPKAIYNQQSGFSSNYFFQIYEDRNRDLWISTHGADERNRLWRWERRTETFRLFTETDGVPISNTAVTFAEDANDNLWIGFGEGGVGRFRDGKFEFFSVAEGFNTSGVSDIYLDRKQRIWIAGNTGGLLRIDAPDAEKPIVSVRYNQSNGLLSGDARTVVEDNFGRIYVGTIRGIDSFNVETGDTRHFGLNEGLPNDYIVSSFRDQYGNLWFGTMNGITRLTPVLKTKPSVPPDVFITGLSADGVARPISDIGEREVKNLEFDSTENNLQINFGAISFAFGENLHFRYKFEGAGEEWSAPTEQRSVNLSLAPGSYRFLIQAVTSGGEPLSDKTAIVSFKILSPIWQRWWFSAAAIILIFAVVYALYRYRVRQLIALERVRTRIASDLHDDIGASLSQIAVVSEVLQRQISADDDERVEKNLSLVARVSREAVDSMSDIVWAINPNRDNLQDLIRRMRRFASETLPNRNIELKFSAPENLPNLKLGADFRREVFLIFKESVNNILKHSDSTEAEIVLLIETRELILSVGDNGKGFSANGDGNAGHGLQNMQSRAESLGGKFEIVSMGGAGTIVRLRVPLRK